MKVYKFPDVIIEIKNCSCGKGTHLSIIAGSFTYNLSYFRRIFWDVGPEHARLIAHPGVPMELFDLADVRL